jgi:nucleoside 2-deoxyribosyltransferase
MIHSFSRTMARSPLMSDPRSVDPRYGVRPGLLGGSPYQGPGQPSLLYHPAGNLGVRVPPTAPPAPAAVPASPLPFTDAEESQMRRDAFLQGLGGLGSRLIAGGAPTTDPSARGRGWGAGGQAFMQNYQGSLGKARQQRLAERKYGQEQAAHALRLKQQGAIKTLAVELGLAPDTPPKIVMEAMKAKRAAGKFGTPTVIADPKSPTGYSRVQVAQDGTIRYLGAAMPQTRMFDPDVARKKADIEHSQSIYKTATKAIDEADKITADVTQMMSLVNRVDSGTLAETKLTIRKFLSAVGIQQDMTKIADAEAMKAKGMGFVLSLIQKTKGAISEKEMEAFKKASAGLENTSEGNTMILALSQKIADRMKFEAEAVRGAYRPGVTAKQLDDVRFEAREKFGSVVPARLQVGDIKTDEATGARFRFEGGEPGDPNSWRKL